MNLNEELEKEISKHWLYIPDQILAVSAAQCEQIAIRYAIEVLEDLEKELRIKLTRMAVLTMPTKEEMDEQWNKTIHHKVIQDKIKELKKAQ